MKILSILPYAPYPIYMGGTNRIFHKLQYLGHRHDLHVAYQYQNIDLAIEANKILSEFCKGIIFEKKPFFAKLLSLWLPSVVRKHHCPVMRKKLSAIKRDFDVIIFEQIFTSVYYDIFKDTFTTIDEQNIESSLLFSLSGPDEHDDVIEPYKARYHKNLRKQAEQLKKYELKMWPKFDLRTTVSESDAEIISRQCSGKIQVVKNGIGAINIQDSPNNKTMLFMGHLGFRPNVQALAFFLEEIYPLLTQVESEYKLIVAGYSPKDKVLQMCRAHNITCYPNPDDMNQVARQCFVSVVPLLSGSGTRIKILQSFAMGIPVVSTTIGAEGLEIKDGYHLMIADTPQTFADSIIKISTDADLKTNLIRNAKRYVDQNHNWETIFSTYERVLLDMYNKSVRH